jgi:hypothetical protein
MAPENTGDISLRLVKARTSFIQIEDTRNRELTNAVKKRNVLS